VTTVTCVSTEIIVNQKRTVINEDAHNNDPQRHYISEKDITLGTAVCEGKPSSI
jgi:hypothetical protein